MKLSRAQWAWMIGWPAFIALMMCVVILIGVS
jgi:hypothetical protein